MPASGQAAAAAITTRRRLASASAWRGDGGRLHGCLPVGGDASGRAAAQWQGRSDEVFVRLRSAFPAARCFAIADGVALPPPNPDSELPIFSVGYELFPRDNGRPDPFLGNVPAVVQASRACGRALYSVRPPARTPLRTPGELTTLASRHHGSDAPALLTDVTNEPRWIIHGAASDYGDGYQVTSAQMIWLPPGPTP